MLRNFPKDMESAEGPVDQEGREDDGRVVVSLGFDLLSLTLGSVERELDLIRIIILYSVIFGKMSKDAVLRSKLAEKGSFSFILRRVYRLTEANSATRRDPALNRCPSVLKPPRRYFTSLVNHDGSWRTQGKNQCR